MANPIPSRARYSPSLFPLPVHAASCCGTHMQCTSHAMLPCSCLFGLTPLPPIPTSRPWPNAHPHRYRNSKLTHILKDSLGGDAKTCVFVNVSPAESNLSETMGTLKFGQVPTLWIHSLPRPAGSTGSSFCCRHLLTPHATGLIHFAGNPNHRTGSHGEKCGQAQVRDSMDACCKDGEAPVKKQLLSCTGNK